MGRSRADEGDPRALRVSDAARERSSAPGGFGDVKQAGGGGAGRERTDHQDPSRTGDGEDGRRIAGRPGPDGGKTEPLTGQIQVEASSKRRIDSARGTPYDGIR